MRNGLVTLVLVVGTAALLYLILFNTNPAKQIAYSGQDSFLALVEGTNAAAPAVIAAPMVSVPNLAAVAVTPPLAPAAPPPGAPAPTPAEPAADEGTPTLRELSFSGLTLTGVGEVAESEQSIAENFRYELAKEAINNFQWTAVLNSRMLNEVKVSSTVEHLRQAARDLYGGLLFHGGRYERTLDLFRRARRLAPTLVTKSGIILGLGEEREELLDAMRDLRAAQVDILTLGQYLRPSAAHLPVARYYHPDEFADLAAAGRAMGFAHVESGPLVRSSYHAKRQVEQSAIGPRD